MASSAAEGVCCPGVTGRPGRCGQTFSAGQHLPARGPGEGHGQGVGQSGVHRGVPDEASDPVRKGSPQHVAKRLHPGSLVGQPGLRELTSSSEAYDAGDVLRAGAQATFLAGPADHGLERCPFPDVQRADTLGP